MALLVFDCPHCSTVRSGLSVFGTRLWPKEFKKQVGAARAGHSPQYRWDIVVGAQCHNCHKPVSAHLTGGGDPQHEGAYEAFGQHTNHKLLSPGNVVDLGFSIVDVWPAKPVPSVPAHVPPAVERAMLQAEKNFPQEGNEEAAAMMYRRALELTLGDLHPALKGSLAARIKNLVGQKVLPQAVGDWADEIRELGNEAAHDPTEVSREELEMIRGFADATLRYLYTLPAEVSARRKTPSDSEDI